MEPNYKELYDELLREAARDGMKRRTAVFIFIVYGAPDETKSPAESPLLGYVQMDTPYVGKALAKARDKFPEATYVYLDEMRGANFDPTHLRYMQEYEARVYEAWLRRGR